MLALLYMSKETGEARKLIIDSVALLVGRKEKRGPFTSGA
mgnify:FL=1